MDTEKFSTIDLSKQFSGVRFSLSSNDRRENLNRGDLINFLSSIEVVEKQVYEDWKLKGQQGAIPKRPALLMPVDKNSAGLGISNNRGVVRLENIIGKSNLRYRVKLSDGFEAGNLELELAAFINSAGAERKDGILEITDKRDGRRKPFNIYWLASNFGNRRFIDGEVTTYLSDFSYDNFKKNFPSIVKSGLILPKDFENIAPKILYYLECAGILENKGGTYVINKDLLLEKSNHEIRGEQVKSKYLPITIPPRRDVIDALLTISAVDKNDLPFGNDEIASRARPVIKNPKDHSSACRGEFDNNGIMETSEIESYAKWDRRIKLNDGSMFFQAELFVARKLKELKSRRLESGVLEIFDTRDGQYKQFTGKLFIDLAGKDPSITEKENAFEKKNSTAENRDRTLKFSTSPALFSEKYLPNLLKSGVLSLDDFRIGAIGRTSELFRNRDQSFGGSNPYIYGYTEGTGGAKYYLGRKKIVGTKIPITPETCARKLDDQTVAILDKSYGRERVVSVFNLLDDREYEARKTHLLERAKKENPSLQWVAMNMNVGGREMKNRVKPYKITDFVKQRNEETAEQYALRISRLSDLKAVTGSFNHLFRKAGVGTHKLLWGEQLVIADMVMDKTTEKQSIDFISKFKLAGLRTFLSLEYGKELGKDIIKLGEILPEAEAKALFAKYGELVDAAVSAENSVREQFPDAEISPEILSDVRENLLRRGRDMLASFSAEVKASENVGYELAVSHITQELSLLRADAALFSATFRELSKRGERLDLSQIKDVSFEQGVSPDTFSAADRDRMRELYRINYSRDPEFREMLLQSFDGVLDDPHNQFYVFRYKGVIEGFYRLGVTAENRVYFGAFNMNPKYKGSGLGEALMQQSLDIRAKDSVIEASCTATLPIASNYIERGFIGVGAKQAKEIYSMDIVRNDAKKVFPSKEMPAEEIMRTCESSGTFTCKKVPLAALVPEDFGLINEKQADGSRFVLTRYIRDKKTNSAYLVFEKTPSETIEDFSSPLAKALPPDQK